jgi:8-amino-7-oxononanoate synthase
VFTASPSPSTIASTRAALKILRSQPQLRQRLWENARVLYQGLKKLDLALSPEPSPIVAVRLQSKEQAVISWLGLIERGVYVNLVVPPATPDGGSLLRCSISAGHTPEQINQICEAFAAIREADPETGTA